MTSLFCIILAGGSGFRLWPISRKMYPNQMFMIDNDYSVFQRTFLNIAGFVDDKNIITSANMEYVSSLKEQLKVLQNKFCRKNEYKIVSEPISKNTAPAIALGTKYITDKLKYSEKSPIIVTFPADKIYSDRIKLTDIISKGINLAKAGYIVSFGAETKDIDDKFEYLKLRKNKNVSEIEESAFKTINFIDKSSVKSRRNVLKGKFFINSGIYMFSADTLFSELKKHCPDIYNIVSNSLITDSIPNMSLSDYQKFPDISIGDAVISKSKKLVTLPLNIDWKNIDCWESIYEISKKDEKGNSFTGNTIDIDSENTLVYSTSKLTATMGLKNKVVVETEDAIFVSDFKGLKNIKNIYKKLNGKNSSKKEIHKTVYRPWGYYTVLENGCGFLTKCITVNPGAKLSVQLHHHRSEHWVILEGQASVIKGDKSVILNSGESIDIGVEEIHSLQNNSKEQLVVFEVQQGDVLDENDIERLEDIYGRV